MSTTWTRRMTEIGLTLMTPKARRERVASLLNDGHIDCERVAALIDECVSAAKLYVDKNEDKGTAADVELIKSYLSKTVGKDAVAEFDDNELAEWVMDLKRTVEEDGGR